MQRLINPDENDLHYQKREFIPKFLSDGQIDLKYMLEQMQDLFADHVERLGAGEKMKQDASFFYIVMRMKGYFLRKIHPGEKFTLVTYPVAAASIQMYRYTYLLDEKNQPVFYHISLWILMNSKTRRITSTKLWNNQIYKVLPDLDEMEPITDEKLINFPIDGYTFQKDDDYQVTSSDIDSNGHMNNSVYLKISQERGKKDDIQIFEIDFEKECFLNENIHVKTSLDEKHSLICGYKEDRSLSFKTLIPHW